MLQSLTQPKIIVSPQTDSIFDVKLWDVVYAFTFFGGGSLKYAILLMSCLTLSIVWLILSVGRAREVQHFRPNPSRRRVPWGMEFFDRGRGRSCWLAVTGSLLGSWRQCRSPCFSTEVDCHQRSSRMCFQFQLCTFQFSFLHYVGGGRVVCLPRLDL